MRHGIYFMHNSLSSHINAFIDYFSFAIDEDIKEDQEGGKKELSFKLEVRRCLFAIKTKHKTQRRSEMAEERSERQRGIK